MIMPLISLVIVVPILIGILSVDINGERISIREFLKSDLVIKITDAIKNNLPSNPETMGVNGIPPEEVDGKAYSVLIGVDFPESQKALDSLNKSIAEGVTFLAFQIKDFGVWLGMSTAPFHYLLAIIIAFSLLFPNAAVFVVGFFYIIIKENKEIRQEIHNARVRKP